MDVLILSIQWGMTILTVPVAARLRRGFYNLLENHKNTNNSTTTEALEKVNTHFEF